MKTIICTNAAGDSLTFPAGIGESAFVLTAADGVTEAKGTVIATDSALFDGSIWQNTRMPARNIVLTLRDRPGADHAGNRAALYTLFRIRDAGMLRFQDGNAASRRIAYVTEYVTCKPDKRSNTYTVSLICPSPWFEAEQESTALIGGQASGFQFMHKFALEPIAANDTAIAAALINDSTRNDIGLTITITAGDAVRNPRIHCIETGETLQLGHAENPLNLASGESVVITTGRGEKRVLDSAGGSLSGYLTEDSEFIQLRSGTNTLKVMADRGTDKMTVQFRWRAAYQGV